MKKLILSLCIILFMFSFASSYEPHKQNTELQFSFTSNNATACNVSTVNTPNGVISINQESTRSGQTFNNTIDSGNFSTLGNYCFNIVCTDGSQVETGSICREISSTGTQGSMFYIILLTTLAAIFLLTTLFVDEEFFVYISGVLWLVGGIYLMINGLDVLNDVNTRYLSYVYLGIGFLFTLGAYIYNSYSKWKDEED